MAHLNQWSYLQCRSKLGCIFSEYRHRETSNYCRISVKEVKDKLEKGDEHGRISEDKRFLETGIE